MATEGICILSDIIEKRITKGFRAYTLERNRTKLKHFDTYLTRDPPIKVGLFLCIKKIGQAPLCAYPSMITW